VNDEPFIPMLLFVPPVAVDGLGGMRNDPNRLAPEKFGDGFIARPNASKAAFIVLCQTLQEIGFMLIDCQVYSDHLASLGAWELPRKEYLALLSDCLAHETRRGSWNGYFENAETRY
ncbi:MAG TPA: hypothetical protein ENN69_06545, partial [Spirochaetia bacterium]|nr:hypothetical protein [Spirochaetia bacterium]